METSVLKPFDFRSKRINRVGYGLMVTTALVSLLLKDWSTAFILMGTSLVFDPFDPEQRWALRPFWQRAWLVIHLIIEIGLLVVTIFTKN